MRHLAYLIAVALAASCLGACAAEEPLSEPVDGPACELEEAVLIAPELMTEQGDEALCDIEAPLEDCPPGEAFAVSAPGLLVEKSASAMPGSIGLGVGESYRIPKGKYKKLAFVSSKKSVAKVSSSGLITGKARGSASITVKSSGRKVAVIKVRVKAAPGRVRLPRSSLALTVGKSKTLKATLPSGTCSRITYKSSDTTIARVNASGTITAVSPGEAKITAATFNGKTASCRVTVNAAQAGGVTVCYDANGGTQAPRSFRTMPDANGVISFKHPQTKPRRNGYTFLGWLCENDGVYYPIDPAGKPVRFLLGSGKLTYTAQWMPESHPANAPYQVSTMLHTDGNTYDVVEGQWKCVQKAEATYWAMHNWYNASGEFSGIVEGSGYAGFQYGDGQTWVILSVWNTDYGTARIEYYKSGARAEPFGGEGDGMHVQTPYPWQEGTWYTMRIQAWSDSSRTYYEQWVRPEGGSWELIAQISYPRPGLGFTWDCFFQEDWIGNNAPRSCQLRRYYARRADTRGWVSLDRYALSNSCGGSSNVCYDCDYANADAATVWVQTGGDGYAAKAMQMPATLQVSQSAQPEEPGFLIIN